MSEPLGRLQAALAPTYVPERELGGGGMSRVFVAVDQALGRRVVVKVLQAELAATLSVERFRREVLLAAGMQHPNVVPVITAGEVEGLPYFVMPYVEGESLKDRLVRGPLSVREAVGVAKDVARALAFAHGRGIVHRDVKPGNVLLAGGAAMVTDFGVAKALLSAHDSGAHRAGARHRPPAATPRPGTAALTAVGVSLGTPAYMAPEQAAADPSADHRADIYSLGVVLFEMLAGTPPFHGRTAQALLTAQLSEPAPPIATRRYDVPQGLADIVMSCLEKDPARRPRSATELLRALEDPTTLSGAFATPPAARRRSRRQLVLGAAGATVAIALLGGWWALARPGEEAVAPAGDASALGAPVVLPGVRGRAVAVVPMVAVAGDARARSVAEGLTSQLAGALTGVPGVRVASVGVPPAPDSALPGAPGAPGLQPAPQPPAPLAADAATLLVQGTVQREGEQLRVVLRLVDPARDSTLWSETFDRAASEVFALQDDAARALVAALALRGGA